MTPFEQDIAAQPEALGRVSRHYVTDGVIALDGLQRLAAGAARVMFVAMGSSRSATLAARTSLGSRRPTEVLEAGELLHYGLASVTPDTLVVLVSQSGRSVETVAVAEQLRAAGHARLVAVTNDETSALARAAQVVLPILAGEEATVATKTWTTTFGVLGILAAELSQPGGGCNGIPGTVIAALGEVSAIAELGGSGADALAGCAAVVVVARGPALAAADYGALILKETAAIPAECLPGGSFRHGPMEMLGPGVGMIVLAPSGPTRDLCVALAIDSARFGSPTWLIVDDAQVPPHETQRLRVTALPALDEAYAPLTTSVPIQRLAAALARERGRVPGVLLRSQKVTDRE